MKYVFRKNLLIKAMLGLFIVLGFSVNAIQAQTSDKTQLTGTVLDENGEGLLGVSVIVPGTTVGVITDINGKFVLSVPTGAKQLTFSYVGYQSQTITIGKTTHFSIVLNENNKELNEVVVIGYGTQKKESTVAAIAQVKGDDLLKVSATSISAALTGQITGVSTVQNSGKPGDDAAKIYIRGVSSWQGNSPLVMVDGVEREFNQIDPNEIETISILKDASATAVFGVRGANGVILITTKRGEKGKVKVSVTGEVTAKTPTGIIAPMNSYNTGLVMNQAARNDNAFNQIISDEVLEHYRTQDMPYVYPSTNWQEIMLKDYAQSQNYNVNISGGTDFARVFTSLSYTGEGDIMNTKKQAAYDPRYKYDKVNYRFNTDINATKTTVLSIDAGGYIGIRNQPFETNNQRLYRPLFTLGPMLIPAEYPASVLETYPDLLRPEETGYRIASTGLANAENPIVANNYSGSRTVRTSNLNVSLKLAQNLDFITKGLLFKATASYNSTTGYERTISYDAVTYRLYPTLTWDRYVGRAGTLDREGPITVPSPSTEGIAGTPVRSWYFEASLNYNRTFGKHAVTALALGQRRKAQDDVSFPSYQQGLATRVTYDYDNRYLLEGNLSVNGSEQFSPEHRYGVFPSFGLGWNLHNEAFFKPLQSAISRAKLRASWGMVGSDAAGSRWLYTSSYSVGGTGNKYNAGTASYPGVVNTLILEDAAANINATWEKAIKQDVGIELSFFKNQSVVLNIDLFKEHRYDILLDRMSVPDWFGVGMKQQNMGETQTHGYEIELKFQHRTKNGLYFWVKPAISFSDNRIITRDEPLYKPEYQKQAGKRIYQLFGNVSQGWVQNADQLMNSTRFGSSLFGLGDTRWVDFNGDGVIDVNDEVPIGYSQQYPLYNLSLNGGLRYKNFDLDVTFAGVTGYSKVVVDAFMWPLHRLTNQVFEYQLDVWSPSNPNAGYPSFRYDANRINNNISDGDANSNTVYDATYVRLKAVNLGYTVPKKITKMLGLGDLNIFLRGNNLFTWSPFYPLSDPEASDDGLNLSNAYYPMLRRFQLGAKLTF